MQHYYLRYKNKMPNTSNGNKEGDDNAQLSAAGEKKKKKDNPPCKTRQK